MKSKINLKNILAFSLGNYRYKLYYSPFKFVFLRDHIIDQIDFRILHMDRECFNNGECKICGCATTALQMANKSCDKPCYPPIVNKTDWHYFYRGQYAILDFENKLRWVYENHRLLSRPLRWDDKKEIELDFQLDELD